MTEYILHINEIQGQTGYVKFSEQGDRVFEWSYSGREESVKTVLQGLNGTEVVPSEQDTDGLVLIKETVEEREKSLDKMRRLMLKLKHLRDVFSTELYKKE